MISFKGILKYLIYIFIAGWMFFLGIMVGRGTSPVTFDTQGFQKRLETIANEFGEKKDIPQKMDLKFYDALDRPVQEESVLSKNKPLEIMPKKAMPVKEISVKEKLEKEILLTPDILPLKKSRKRLTFKKITQKAKTDIGANGTPKIKQGKYTIQIAAYKEFKDAITQMALLEEKGFSSYRIKGGKDGATWYRVRIGSFSSWDEAQKIIEKLNIAGIKAQIVEKGS
ncbi:MAG: SPOR domain-containing protein [Desulfobacula sp.]|jgi:cell division protein FtsN|nr:SPOR domain-containing protein [Desulfobacula sp.]MBT6339908.1 SPOR domain-containing protein [Desulfobacula sp.]MBT7261322.1 SPOR domain-containing protein [Desulfobacula sp.]